MNNHFNSRIHEGFKTEYLTVLRHAGFSEKFNTHYWVAECHLCGNEFELRSGMCRKQKSCGCVSSHYWRGINPPKPKVNEETMHQNIDNWLRKRWV